MAIRYSNQDATRNLPLSDPLSAALNRIAPRLGVTVDVYSGGQPAYGSGKPRVGSTRHDDGNAADIRLIDSSGSPVNFATPEGQALGAQFVQLAKAEGLTGFGQGADYMGDTSMHVGYGKPAVWGADGKGANAPEWLRAAWEGTGARTGEGLKNFAGDMQVRSADSEKRLQEKEREAGNYERTAVEMLMPHLARGNTGGQELGFSGGAGGGPLDSSAFGFPLGQDAPPGAAPVAPPPAASASSQSPTNITPGLIGADMGAAPPVNAEKELEAERAQRQQRVGEMLMLLSTGLGQMGAGQPVNLAPTLQSFQQMRAEQAQSILDQEDRLFNRNLDLTQEARAQRSAELAELAELRLTESARRDYELAVEAEQRLQRVAAINERDAAAKAQGLPQNLNYSRLAERYADDDAMLDLINLASQGDEDASSQLSTALRNRAEQDDVARGEIPRPEVYSAAEAYMNATNAQDRASVLYNPQYGLSQEEQDRIISQAGPVVSEPDRTGLQKDFDRLTEMRLAAAREADPNRAAQLAAEADTFERIILGPPSIVDPYERADAELETFKQQKIFEANLSATSQGVTQYTQRQRDASAILGAISPIEYANDRLLEDPSLEAQTGWITDNLVRPMLNMAGTLDMDEVETWFSENLGVSYEELSSLNNGAAELALLVARPLMQGQGSVTETERKTIARSIANGEMTVQERAVSLSKLRALNALDLAAANYYMENIDPNKQNYFEVEKAIAEKFTPYAAQISNTAQTVERARLFNLGRLDYNPLAGLNEEEMARALLPIIPRELAEAAPSLLSLHYQSPVDGLYYPAYIPADKPYLSQVGDEQITYTRPEDGLLVPGQILENRQRPGSGVNVIVLDEVALGAQRAGALARTHPFRRAIPNRASEPEQSREDPAQPRPLQFPDWGSFGVFQQ